MLNKYFYFFGLFILTFSTYGVELSSLKVFYSSLTKFDAKIVQSKHSEYLLRPFKSYGSFSYTPEKIIWSIEKPVKSSIEIGKNLKLFGSQGEKDVPVMVKNKIFQIVSIIKRFFDGDISGIKKDFSILQVKNVLKIIPKSKEMRELLKSLELHFTDRLQLTRVVVISNDEKSIIEFKDVKTNSK